MIIDYSQKMKKFLISGPVEELFHLKGIQDKTYRKRDSVYIVPPFRKNIEYINTKLTFARLTDKARDEVNRRLDNLAKAESRLTGFPHWFKHTREPTSYQNFTLNKFYPLDYGAIFYEQGMGKSNTGLTLMLAWAMDNQIDAIVIIAPASTMPSWKAEIPKVAYMPHSALLAIYSTKNKIQRFLDDLDSPLSIMVITVESLSQGNMYDSVIEYMAARRCGIILDESAAIKTPGTIRTEKTLALGQAAHKRIIMDGTPDSEGLEEFYTQYNFLSEDILECSNYRMFKLRYCNTYTMEMPVKGGRTVRVDKIEGYKNEEDFYERIAPYTVRFDKKSAGDFPEKVLQVIEVPMSTEQKRLYREMKGEFSIEVDNKTYEVTSSLEHQLRLMEITGGFVTLDEMRGDAANIGDWENEDEDVEYLRVKTRIEGNNNKLEEVIKYTKAVDGKVVIWCVFRSEIDLFEERLKKDGIKYATYHGGNSPHEKNEAVTSFREDESIKVMLASKAAYRGVEFEAAAYSFYYSLGPSCRIFLQSMDRTHRLSSKHNKCNYILFQCSKTVDVENWEKVIQPKMSLFENSMHHIAKNN